MIPYIKKRWSKYFKQNVFPKETVTALIMFYKDLKVMVRLVDGVTDFIDILSGDILASFLFIIFSDDVLRTSIDLMKENGSPQKMVVLDSICYFWIVLVWLFTQFFLHWQDVTQDQFLWRVKLNLFQGSIRNRNYSRQ